MTRRLISRAAVAVLIGSLCGGPFGAVPVAAQDVGTDAQRESGKNLYGKYCAQCHGDKGDGEGYATSHLSPRPRNFTSGKFKVRTTPNGALPTHQDLVNIIRRGMLASLGSKLAILGPPRIVAEVPDANAPARGLFAASGYVPEAVLTDYVLSWDANSREHGDGAPVEGFVIPVTIDDLAANGLLGDADRAAGVACWQRSVETLRARKDEVSGLAVASDERIEAYLLYVERGGGEGEIVAFRSLVEDGTARLAELLSRLRAGAMKTVRFAKVAATEIEGGWLETLGFSRAGDHSLYAATARSQ